MSDSDVDLLPNSVYTFQNESTTVSARGPNINASNLTGLSFRNNIMTSTMNIPRNFERQKYLEQSTYYRHPSAATTSPPMSLRSESSFRPRNYQHMYYPRGMSSQRSMINGRSGSPMSMRSIDSNATVSAADIAMAFKNMNFNKYDLRVIKDAYNQFMKRRMRRKIEKRRNLRLFLKGQRRKSGYDSGELGSDSSISSDDDQSTRTSVYKDNMSSCRSTRTNYSDIRKTMRDGNLYKDCTDNFRQNTFKNMLGVAPSTAPRNAIVHSKNTDPSEQPLTQKDRFKSGFLLPSQRFNQSVASVPIPEKQSRVRNLPVNQRNDLEFHHNTTRNDSEMESEQEEIFSEITIKEKIMNITSVHGTHNVDPRKRCIEVDEVMSQNKRSKLSSPPKNNNNIQQKPENGSKNKNCNEFEFLKPQFPVRKSSNIKVKETLLAKSTAPFIDEVVCVDNVLKLPVSELHHDQNDENKEANDQPDLTQQSSDLSMRPSFIKRKLYTQKLDMLESKNLSSDNLGANSPQMNVYSSIQKEKNRARKLVTNQSCLSRDVREDNNLLDLIHKIVPPDRMNVTNVTSKTEANNIAKNKSEDDRWDVTSVMNTYDNDDVSDTYTDEEIFNNENSKKQSISNEDNIKVKQTENKQTNDKRITKEKNPMNEKKGECKAVNEELSETIEKKQTKETKSINQKLGQCKVLIEKLPQIKNLKKNPATEKENSKDPKDANKENIYNCVKSFWDTDFESDVDTGPMSTDNRVKEKETRNHGLIQKAVNNVVNKTHDTNQSKFVWNNKSKTAVTLKSHSFVGQVKAVNINKSFTKRSNEKHKNENLQSKDKLTKASDKTAEPRKKASCKNIVLDTYNSTVSNNTQNESVIDANNKTHATHATKKNEKLCVDKNDNLKSLPQEKEKASKRLKNKTQANEVDKKISSRKLPHSPREFSCCKEPIHDSKKAKKEVVTKAKNNKTALDNYNSTFSDNTLDEIIKKGNRTRALRATRKKKVENSILDDLKRDDSQMLNMTLRSRRVDTSFAKGNNEKTKLPKKAEVKARNIPNSSQTKDTQTRNNKSVVTPVKNQKTVSKNIRIRQSPRIHNKAVSTVPPIHKRAVKCK
ncbi:probable WRKY transcription factor protein 1 [Plodia interpunctella]|uniref:probable WRKY transcription factor protein 1 n=1 Tax=Plodia interpunctella TaxID=58824 RepID=UPI00236895E4|nr:probable WRKY transcription factor protein 1 [Plodia interpunctella]